ncbi:MAG TPA: hypothetical protein VIY72_12710, partial [Acidimicrobiales bacterium]
MSKAVAEKGMPSHPPSAARQSRLSSRRSVGAISWAVLAVGLVLSLTGGMLWKGIVDRREADALDATASSVQSVVSTQLDRQEDLLRSVAGLVVSAPGLSNGEFTAWYDGASAADRYPENLGIGFVEKLPAEQLDAFQRLRQDDPMPGVDSSGWDEIVNLEPGADQVCLLRLGLSRDQYLLNALATGGGIDFCSSELAPGEPSPFVDVMAATAASGSPMVVSFDALEAGLVIELLPVYRSGGMPADASARAEATIG